MELENQLTDQQVPLAALNNPIKVGDLTLTSRAVMAPLTRCRAMEGSDHVPGDLMVEHYRQRAAPGSLIIAEATMVCEGQSAFWNEPGIYSDDQVAGWKKVVDAVHAKGGYIFLQIWHGGRACHPLNSQTSETPEGNQPVAPSVQGNQVTLVPHRSYFNSSGKDVPYATPRALSVKEIRDTLIIPAFVQAAKNAVHGAGFDGVEIHGANGYLVDEFLRSSTNQRPFNEEDPFNGRSFESRAQFLFSIIDRIVFEAKVPTSKIGLRISPINSCGGDMMDDDPIGLTKFLGAALSGGVDQQQTVRKLAYLHVMRGDFFQKQTGDVVAAAKEGLLTASVELGVEEQGAGPLSPVPTALMVNMGYTPREADDTISRGTTDLVCFGKLFINNPDLVDRLSRYGDIEKQQREGNEKPDAAGQPQLLPLLSPKEADASTFYSRGACGYNDYPSLAEQWEQQEKVERK